MIPWSTVVEIGPVAFALVVFVWYVVPDALRRVGGIAERIVQGQHERASQPLRVLETVIEGGIESGKQQNSRLDLVAMELMGVKTRQDQTIDMQNQMLALLKQIFDHLKEDQS